MENDHIKALDLARDGYWGAAHKLIQDNSDEKSCLIHAYLHRVEGDLENANYWYRRAHTEMPKNTLEEEFDRLYEMAR